MKRQLKIFFLAGITALMFFTGCDNANTVVDLNTPVSDHNWTYLNKFYYNVKIDDEKAAYNLYMNLRITADYKYSNIFVLIAESGPGQKPRTKRYELKLASKDGEWLGKGSGNLYTYQSTFYSNYKFPAKGVYHFVIEQNMRDNPLREVNDVGLRVEKVAP